MNEAGAASFLHSPSRYVPFNMISPFAFIFRYPLVLNGLSFMISFVAPLPDVLPSRRTITFSITNLQYLPFTNREAHSRSKLVQVVSCKYKSFNKLGSIDEQQWLQATKLTRVTVSSVNLLLFATMSMRSNCPIKVCYPC